MAARLTPDRIRLHGGASTRALPALHSRIQVGMGTKAQSARVVHGALVTASHPMRSATAAQPEPLHSATASFSMTALPRARLAGYREQSGAIRFRIASSPSVNDTVEELKRRVPSWARRYDPQSHEWSVNADYRTVLESLFINTPSAFEPAGGPGHRAARRDAFANDAQYTSRARMLWFLLALAAIAATGALLWSRNLDAPLSTPQLQTVAAQTEQAAALSAPPSGPIAGRVNSIANLRAAPGTDAAVLRKAAAGENVSVVGKLRAADNYWWLALDDGLWIRSDLVVRTEAGELPLDLSRLPEVDTTGAVVAPPPPIPAAAEAAAQSGQAPAMVSGNVLFIVDGDTIHVNVEGREVRVRYIGIDTPERDEYGYESATLANRALVEGRNVRLVADADNMDDYSRLLRYVYVDHDDNPATPDLFVNRALIEQGWADVMTIAPNTAHANDLSTALSAAQSAKVGLWQ